MLEKEILMIERRVKRESRVEMEKLRIGPEVGTHVGIKIRSHSANKLDEFCLPQAGR